MKTREDGEGYFWSLGRNSFLNIEKNIFDCQITIAGRKGNRTASIYFMTPNSEILFAEFTDLKLSSEFREKMGKNCSGRYLSLQTKTINPEKLISYLSKINCGKNETGRAFDKFICSWL